jgi:acyl carrier protein
MTEGLPLSPIENPPEERVRRLIRDLILELAPNPENVALEDPRLLDDLEYHSLALLELAFTLEDEFDLEPIDAETAQTIRTSKDVEDYVVEKLRQRAETG